MGKRNFRLLKEMGIAMENAQSDYIRECEKYLTDLLGDKDEFIFDREFPIEGYDPEEFFIENGYNGSEDDVIVAIEKVPKRNGDKQIILRTDCGGIYALNEILISNLTDFMLQLIEVLGDDKECDEEISSDEISEHDRGIMTDIETF